MITQETVCIIMGGGRGTRMFPLTKNRSKPAVPFGGRYRLIDVPISNCLNSGFNKIIVLTQYNSESLNKHINRAYKLDNFSKGYVEVLAADMSDESAEWFQGTADAVRRSLKHLNDPAIKEVIVLSGDQLYAMDLLAFQAVHRKTNADVTVACHPVPTDRISAFGIMSTDDEGRIVSFVEKPKDPGKIAHKPMTLNGADHYLASMGIYIFKKDVLKELLQTSDKDDFGKEIIPDSLQSKRVFAYLFEGYWEDIGTIKSYFKANLMLTDPVPPFNLYNEGWQIYSRPRYLPAVKMGSCRIKRSLVAEGSIIQDDVEVDQSVIGVRSVIGKGSKVENTVLSGHDFYESDEQAGQFPAGTPGLGIGSGCVIRQAIIDKNTRIGNNVRILNEKGLDFLEGKGYTIRDGIVVVHKGSVIPDNTVI